LILATVCCPRQFDPPPEHTLGLGFGDGKAKLFDLIVRKAEQASVMLAVCCPARCFSPFPFATVRGLCY